MIATPPRRPSRRTWKDTAGVGIGAIGQQNVDAGRGERLGGRARELGRAEARVVADDDAPRVTLAGLRGVPAGGRRRDAADLGEGAVVGDDAAPTVGSERDRQRARVPAETRNAASRVSSKPCRSRNSEARA